MFNIFRKKSPTEKLYFIIGAAIILAFILTVITQLPKWLTSQVYVGEIFNKKITQEHFDRAYRHHLTLTKFQYGQMFEKIEPLLDLEKDTWEKLILLKEADKRNIKVSDKEVVEAIAQYKVFFRNKKFDELLYKQIIRLSLQAHVKDFEEAIRESLIIEKLRQEVTSAVTFSEDQLRKEFQRHHTKAQIAYALIPADSFKDQITIPEQEMRDYYQQHQYDFFVPPTIKVEYIRADYPPDAGVQKKVETKFKAKAIRKEHQEGQSFKAMAEKFKYTLYESDYFHRQQLTFPFGPNKDGHMLKMDQAHKLLKRLFAMEVGQTTEPVEWDKGYLVIKLKEKRDAYLQSFDQAKEKIKKKLMRQKTLDLAKNKAQSDLNQIKSSWDPSLKKEGFLKLAHSLGLKTSETEMMPLKHLIFTLNLRQKAWPVLFDLTPQSPLSPPAQTNSGYILMYLAHIKPADMSLFEKQKTAFAEQITKEKKDEVYNDFLNSIRKKADLKRFPVKK